MSKKPKPMSWRGSKNKSIKLTFNNITPVFHSRLLQETRLKCGCGDKLALNSEVYVFRVESKDKQWTYHKHFGASCGREIIELSNKINGTNYSNIYFMEPLNVRDEETLIQSYGLQHHERHNNAINYSRFNKTYLVAIFILCNAWSEPYPYGSLAEVIDTIHARPETDCYVHLGFFNRAIQEDKQKRTLSQMLNSYRARVGVNAFRNIDFTVLHDFISKELKMVSLIL